MVIQNDGVKRLQDSELKVMKVLWRLGEAPARTIAGILETEQGWNLNTTYTLIKRCIQKNAVERVDPGFICRPLIDEKSVQRERTEELIDKIYDGSADRLFAALIDSKKLSDAELARLVEIVKGAEK